MGVPFSRKGQGAAETHGAGAEATGQGQLHESATREALRGRVLKRALSMVEISTVATLKFLIMLSLNLGFVNEIWWDNGVFLEQCRFSLFIAPPLYLVVRICHEQSILVNPWCGEGDSGISESKVSMWHLQLSHPLGRELITPWGYPFYLNPNWTQNKGKWPKILVISSLTMSFPVVANHLGWKGWQRGKDKTIHYSFSFYTILTTSKPKVRNVGRIYAYEEVKWKQLSIAYVAFILLWWRIKYVCIPELGHANSVVFRDAA